MKLKLIFTLAIIAVFGQQCIKEVDFNPTGTIETMPIFHAYMKAGESTKASFFSTDGVLNPDKPINNNNIKLSIGFNDYYFNSTGNGNYELNGNPLLANMKYKLSFDLNNKNYLVSGKVPNTLSIEALDTQTGPRATFGKSFVIDFTFTDSALYNNYYRVFLVKHYYLYKKINKIIVDSTLESELISIYGNELAFVQNNFNNYTNKEILFDDITFNGVKNKYEVYTNANIRSDADSRTLKLELVLENIEPSLYNYYNSRNAHLWQQNSITQTPGIVVGNIPAGFGVVGTYTDVKYEIKLK